MRRRGSNSPISSILFGLLFMTAGIVTILVFSQLPELMCIRLEPSALTCTRTLKLFGLVTTHEEELPTLKRAYLSESCDSDGCSYRVDLETAGGAIALVNYYTGGIGAYDQQTEKANTINNFLSDTEETELLLGPGMSEILLSFLPLLFLLIGGLAGISGLRQFFVNLDDIR